MLFTCQHCSFGHSAMDVEKFYSTASKKHIYLCKEHLNKRGGELIHIPWDDQLLLESNMEGTCTLCKPTRASCVGFTGRPQRPLLLPQNKQVPSPHPSCH